MEKIEKLIKYFKTQRSRFSNEMNRAKQKGDYEKYLYSQANRKAYNKVILELEKFQNGKHQNTGAI